MIYEEKYKNTYWVKIGIAYTLLVMIFGGYLNYIMPYDPRLQSHTDTWAVILWSLLYIPLIVFSLSAKWKIKDFGFSINSLTLVTALLLGGFCSAISPVQTSWSAAIVEAFARTGEELFFRGFVFLLLMEIFKRKNKPWIWAVVLSSLLFALVHTQTFQSSYFSTHSPLMIDIQIADRLFNVFLAALVLALLRYWTKSILPGSLAHSIVQGGWLTIPFTLSIYALITLLALIRGEDILPRSE